METGEYSIQTYLIQRCKKGDRKAQNELYKLYAGAMYNICRRMMGDEDDARDILQESFIDVFTKLNKLENEQTFAAWIKRIVVNNCINALKRKTLAFSEMEEGFDVVDIHDENDDENVQYEVKRVMNAMDQISEGCRVVAGLYLFEGYDHKEIGQILDITESASKAQYSKAKAKIRKILSDN